MGADPRAVWFMAKAVGVSLVCAAGCGSVQWEYSLERGLEKAARQKRPVLVEFHSALNSDCLTMDQDVFTDPDVQERLEDFVCVRLDHQLNRDLAARLGVEVLPTFFVFRCDRSLAGSHAGRLDAGRFNVFLIKYRYY